MSYLSVQKIGGKGTKLSCQTVWQARFLCILLVVCPQLPAVEQVLPDGVEGQEDGSQWVEVGIGHPNAYRRVLLAQHLAACHAVAVVRAYPFAYTEMNKAYCCRHYA